MMWFDRLAAGEGLNYLPEGVEEYIGIQTEKKLWVRIFGVFVGIFLVYYGFRVQKYYISIFGVMLALASLMFKDYAVTEKGVEIRYLLPGWHFESLWSWSEVTTVLADYKQSAPNVSLLIGKGNVHRRVVVNKAEARNIKELSREQNPAIRVADMKD